jgi:hypothetical protein
MPTRHNPVRALPARLAQAFAPIHKSALGVAVGATVGAVVAALTLFHVVFQPVNGPPLVLLGQYFYGYTVSWAGAAIGLFWGFVSGFVAGWFVAFVRNFTLAVWLLVIKARAALSQPFLDHI